MVQSGPPEEWWDCEMERDCYLRNVYDKMADGKTAHENTLIVYNLVDCRTQRQLQAQLFGRRGNAASTSQKDASRNIHGICFTCGRTMVRRIAHCGLYVENLRASDW